MRSCRVRSVPSRHAVNIAEAAQGDPPGSIARPDTLRYLPRGRSTQRPRQTGRRFSAKAKAPSRASSLPVTPAINSS